MNKIVSVPSEQQLPIFTDPTAQLHIAWAIRGGRFGTNPDVLKAVAGQLTMFTDPTAQLHIALAISGGYFGNDTAVLKAVAGQLAMFTDPTAQQRIAWAISGGKFGNDPEVLKAVAGQLAMFTDPTAQLDIALAISGGYFGNDTEVLKAVAGQLAIFTDPSAQLDIAGAIRSGKFGNDPDVLKDLAGQLAMFTHPYAQLHIAVAISDGKFGTNPEVLKAVAGQLDMFTDPDAQQRIAWAIRGGNFGTNPDVLKVLAEHLPVFTDRNAKITLSDAIGNGSLGVDAGVLKTLYRRNMVSLKGLMTSRPSMQTDLSPEFKFKLTPPSGILETDPSLTSFFGAKLYLSSEVKTALKGTFVGMSDDGLEFMCDDNATYAFQIYGNYAVLCKIGAGSVSEASFQGWITSDFPMLYKDTLGKVAVYNCSVLTDGYPSKMEVSETHAEFNALPMYLMEAIRENSFDSSKFTHPKTIDFVASTILGPIVEKNPDLGNKMKGIIQQAILNEGRDVSIASTPAEDGAIKDAINALCLEVKEAHDFEVSVMTYFNSLNNDQDKARLAYLLGQIAKEGVLGYHHEERNQANDLFYSLSKKCFNELKSSRAMVFPDNFHTNLAAGVCIAQETSRFFSLNAWVKDIFDKN